MLKTLYLKFAKKYLQYTTSSTKPRKVFFGPLKGLKWIYSSGYTSFWMGTYEKEITTEFIRYVKNCNVIYDLGAHIGFYSLLSAKYMADQGEVFSFEPLPQNFEKLKRHVDLNNLSRVTVFQKAISNKTGSVQFSNSENTVANTLIENSSTFREGKTIHVESVLLDRLLEQGTLKPPQLIKMDIEGAEYDGLLGAKKLLTTHRPTIFLSTHNCHIRGIHKKCCDLLMEFGYDIRYLDYHKKETEFDDPWYEIVAEYKARQPENMTDG